jgi:hypothetical protein
MTKIFDGQYVMKANLGQNRKGNSKVYLCVNKQKLNEQFAIKMVQGDVTDLNQTEINGMKDEYAKLFRVDHVNIIKVYGQGKSHITKKNCKQKHNIFYLKM